MGREVATWRDEQLNQGERFWYNTAGMLVNVIYNADNVWTGIPINGTTRSIYNYAPDLLNRTSVNDNGYLSPWVNNGLNQYTSINGETIGYDGNFNLTGLSGAIYTFNAVNQLVSATNNANSASFVYDGLGRCLKRTINNGTAIITYDDWKPIVEWNENGSMAGANVYGVGPDEILFRYDAATGQQYRYHLDRHGNVASLVDWNGNGIEKYSYDAFGTPTVTDWWGGRRTTSAFGNRFMFQGREWLGEFRIYDYRRRMYNPSLGRFLQSDPMGLQTEGEKLSAGQKALFSPGGVAPEAFGSTEMNLFRYCGDDPMDGSDPFGLEVQGSLEFYIMDRTLGRGHMNFVLHDTTTGQTMIGRGMPSEDYRQSAVRSLLNAAQPSKWGIGNVKLKMDVNAGTRGVDPATGNKTTTVPGSVTTLKDDMKTATSKLNQVAAQITGTQRDYLLQTVNSNIRWVCKPKERN